mmetsp:Transcript_18456/g.63660  ORF Transcript_18456/g.63660 Transcript_18456/m.63660 type:complete len:207 (-) Transcript_18456:7-627(-)
MRAVHPTNFFLKARPVGVTASTLIHLDRETSPLISGNERQPSVPATSPSDLATICGFTRTISSSHLSLLPVGLKTIRRLLMPTCGAARPTPSASYMSWSMRRPSACVAATSSSAMISFGARRAGCGYMTMRSPATRPGSTSSLTGAAAREASRGGRVLKPRASVRRSVGAGRRPRATPRSAITPARPQRIGVNAGPPVGLAVRASG